MKKGFGLFLFIIILCACFVAGAEVEINEINFPDASFREYVRQFDTDQDGSFNDAEIQEIRIVDCANQGITSLQGIHYFSELSILSCRDNQITNLDISQNPQIYWVYCERNLIKTLTAKNLTEIEQLCCQENQLSELDVTGCPLLSMLVSNHERQRDEDGSDCWRYHYSADCWYQLSVDSTVKVNAGGVISEPLIPIYAQGVCGNSITWILDNAGKLTISGTGEMPGNYPWSYGWWEKYRNQICSIEIKNGITSIGDCAFYNEVNLEDVVIPSSVTSIGNYAFDYCRSLPSIQLPDTITSIGDCAFRYCYALRSANLPRNLVSIGSFAFMFCPDVVISIPSDRQLKQHIRFYDSSLCSLSLPESITEIGVGAFLCTDIPVDLNVTPDFTLPEDLNTIGDEAFSGISAAFISMPNNNWDEKTTIGSRAFADCKQLQYILIGDCFEIEISNDAFSGCNDDLVIIDDTESIGDVIHDYAINHGIKWIKNEYYMGDG